MDNLMKSRITTQFLAALLLLVAFTPLARAEDAGPTVLKPSMNIMVTRYLRYFATPAAKEPVYNTWSWRPRYNFSIAGPIAGGSQISISFFKPDGSLWMTMPCPVNEIGAGQTVNVVNPNDSTPDAERHTTTAVGVYSFKITLKNPLASTNKTLYAGKFTINKFHVGPNLPVNKGQWDFYVEHDWLLPIGYFGWKQDPSEEAPQVMSLMWFRGDIKQEQIAAYLYYKGKQICSTGNSEQGSGYPQYTLIPPSTPEDPRWVGYVFRFSKVAAYNKMISANQYPDTFFLDKNPGLYEIKVLVKGQLARTTSFTVGEDGKVVDNGIAAANGIASMPIILPVKVLPGADLKVIPATLQSDAFYGNPLSKFILP
jgi:hypothetical protein